MKRIKHLYPLVYDFQNLLRAAQRAQRGKRFRPDVAEFNLDMEKELFQLQEDLKNKTYRHGRYHHFPVFEGKKRIISSAPYRDRIVHHALCNVIEPIFEKTFISDSYACRKWKGSHAAVNRLTYFIRKNRYAMKIDVRKYFPSICHDTLLAILRRKIGDRDVLWLIQSIIDSYEEPPRHDEKGNLLFSFNGPTGIPIGNLTSQFFANVYLNGLDHFIKQNLGCRAYIRYVDDLVFLGSSKKRLHEIRVEVQRYLNEKLGLEIHENQCQPFPVTEGIDFLGYRVFRTHRFVRDGNGYRFFRRFKRLRWLYREKRIRLENVTQSVVSWIGHVSHADSWGFRTELLRECCL